MHGSLTFYRDHALKRLAEHNHEAPVFMDAVAQLRIHYTLTNAMENIAYVLQYAPQRAAEVADALREIVDADRAFDSARWLEAHELMMDKQTERWCDFCSHLLTRHEDEEHCRDGAYCFGCETVEMVKEQENV